MHFPQKATKKKNVDRIKLILEVYLVRSMRYKRKYSGKLNRCGYCFLPLLPLLLPKKIMTGLPKMKATNA